MDLLKCLHRPTSTLRIIRGGRGPIFYRFKAPKRIANEVAYLFPFLTKCKMEAEYCTAGILFCLVKQSYCREQTREENVFKFTKE